ncbi:hypothetical protein [Parvibaculum sp.]|uniref:hypothetical protein n=1 Tax=Parvibaculum sp. TaxID=2024848 RepID=UPI0025CEE538|nr:hypothetical protein [Parvibaculum sp.]
MRRFFSRGTKILSCALILIFCSDVALAGGWPRAPGSGELITTVSRMRSNARTEDKIDTSTGKISPFRYRKTEITSYLELGLIDDLTAIGELAHTKERSELVVGTFENSGISRIKAGFRYAIGTWEETLFSIQPLVTLHLEDISENPVMIHSGDVDAEIALVLARSDSFMGVEVFSVQEIGWSWRNSDRPDEVRADITLGAKPRPGTMFLLKSLNGAALDSLPNEKHYRSNKLAFSLVQDLPQNILPGTAFEAGVERFIDGQGTIDDTTFRVGLWYRF